MSSLLYWEAFKHMFKSAHGKSAKKEGKKKEDTDG